MERDFDNQLRQYATGAETECQHPINRVGDDYVCQDCGMDMGERKHTKSFNHGTMTLATGDDILRMWTRLWGNMDKYEVAGMTLNYYRFGNEPLDFTQEINNERHE